ncbi:MAG: glycosyltransferase family 2 protein [Candidatus Caccovivens sp.]
MEIFNSILYWINYVLLGIASVAFIQQFIYTLLFFVKPKKFKKSEIKHKFAVFIPARNEEDAIVDVLVSLQKQNYPKELIDIFVIVNNSTDNTADVCRKIGKEQVTVLEYTDNDPNHHRAAYPVKYFFDYIKQNDLHYDAFIRFDADNYVDENYVSCMNDALSSGAKLAKGYNSAKNLTQNVISGISGLWYIRDCRFNCQVRSRIGCTQILVGSGMMISDEIMKRKNYEWTALGVSEDAEFSMDELFAGNNATYVSDAVVYEDEPTTIKDTFNRNVRMGHGLFKMFFTHGLKSLWKFFTTFKYKYLDMFFNFLFIPIAVVLVIWMPAYYCYDIIYNCCVGNFAYVIDLAKFIGIILVFAFLIPFIAQAFLVYFLDKKKINTPIKKLIPSMLLFPGFMIIYALGITWGALTKPKWKQIKRNKVITQIELPAETSKLKSQKVMKLNCKNTDKGSKLKLKTNKNLD